MTPNASSASHLHVAFVGFGSIRDCRHPPPDSCGKESFSPRRNEAKWSANPKLLWLANYW